MTEQGTQMPQDLEWEVDGLRLTGLAWGAEGGTPVLALHGWMDHADSFKVLAPLLEGCRVVALDLSGQGLSAHRAPHATYNIWDDLPQIADVLDQLGWDDCVLVGHSRGANISALFAAAMPERVRALVSLDCIVPEPVEDDSFVPTLRAFIEDTRKQKARGLRTFESQEAYVARRQAQGNSPEVSNALAPRALAEGPEGLNMRGDPRLFASSAVKLTQSHLESVLSAIQCPVLNVWAQGGLKSHRPKTVAMAARAAELITDYETLDLPGDHHFHLYPKAAADIAGAVLGFLDQYALR